MLKYFFSLLFLLVFNSGFSQKLPERQKFIRLGIDLSRFALPQVGEIGSKGFEASIDAEVKTRFFPTIEAGYQEIDHHTTIVHYQMYGQYARIGFDYNIIKYKHRLDRNLFYIGARLAYTQGWHQAPEITLKNSWGSVETSMEKQNIDAIWFEGMLGLKGELVKNLYMGASVRIKSMIAHSDYGHFTPYILPGFGKGYNFINTGINYSIYYAIPIKNPKLDFENKTSTLNQN
jgi:hypothetical protein